jgi:hypothetical protein
MFYRAPLLKNNNNNNNKKPIKFDSIEMLTRTPTGQLVWNTAIDIFIQMKDDIKDTNGLEMNLTYMIPCSK